MSFAITFERNKVFQIYYPHIAQRCLYQYMNVYQYHAEQSVDIYYDTSQESKRKWESIVIRLNWIRTT